MIGVPDPVAGSAVKAFVELKAGQVASEALRKDILAHARRQLGVAVAPSEIAFGEQLPRTRSGKIMRRLLRGQGTRPARGRPVDAGGRGMNELPAGITENTACTCSARCFASGSSRSRCAELYGAGKIRGFLHLYDRGGSDRGRSHAVLGKGDAVVSTYREHGHAIARGIGPDR